MLAEVLHVEQVVEVIDEVGNRHRWRGARLWPCLDPETLQLRVVNSTGSCPLPPTPPELL